tara:strand:+ start:3868 stop:5223 length:1356 start_codon:yes stop_codon:yes gene_type:complete
MENKISYLNKIIRIIFFVFIYSLITKADLYDILFVFFLVSTAVLISKNLLDKRNKGKLLFIISFFLLIPLGLPVNLSLIILPPGYQYICISLIASILFFTLREKEIKDLSIKNLILLCTTATFTPTTYISGPSASIKELEKSNVKKNGIPNIKSLKNFNLTLAISGFFRITTGYLLSSANFELKNYTLSSDSILNLFFTLIIFGFFNFWKYYLLFSGASELCKSLLSIIGIDLIDNFKNPEDSVFYHEIWGRWHLNITDRIRNYLFTPITLFALRKFSLFNKTTQFFLIEGLPAITLFFLLAIWHGAKPVDFLFAIVSTFLTIFSRALSKLELLKKALVESNFLREIFRVFTISLFGMGLSIYELKFSVLKDLLNEIGNINNFIPYIIISFIIYLYFRIKGFIFNKKNINSTKNSKNKLILVFFEFVIACLMQIFWISGISIESNFIYFAG